MNNLDNILKKGDNLNTSSFLQSAVDKFVNMLN